MAANANPGELSQYKVGVLAGHVDESMPLMDVDGAYGARRKPGDSDYLPDNFRSGDQVLPSGIEKQGRHARLLAGSSHPFGRWAHLLGWRRQVFDGRRRWGGRCRLGHSPTLQELDQRRADVGARISLVKE